MKLYEIPNNSIIQCEVEAKGKTYKHIVFHHIDGMYSYCTVGDTKIPCHLSVMTELTKHNDGSFSIQ